MALKMVEDRGQFMHNSETLPLASRSNPSPKKPAKASFARTSEEKGNLSLPDCQPDGETVTGCQPTTARHTEKQNASLSLSDLQQVSCIIFLVGASKVASLLLKANGWQ